MATQHPQTERWLESYGVTGAQLATIPLERIDIPASHANQARLTGEPINEEVALGYGLSMERGDVFPPIIVTPTAKGYLVIDGNHRVAGTQLAKKDEIDAYVITNVTTPQRMLLTFDANTRHGYRTTTNERIQQALALVANGVTTKAAAEALNLPTDRLVSIVGGRETERQLTEAGINTSKLTMAHFTRLGSLRSHPVRIAAAKWFDEQKVGTVEASATIAALNNLHSEAEQLAFIARESGKRVALVPTTARGRIQLPPAIASLQRAVTEIERIDPSTINNTAVNERLTPDVKTVLAARVLDASVRLKRLGEKLTNQ